QVKAESLQSAFEFAFGAIGNLLPRLRTADMQIGAVEILGAPAVHLDLNLPGQFAAQVIDMHTRPSIDMGWILPCEEANSHGLCLAALTPSNGLTGGCL